jgi:DNA-directed RNA polymerase III subunit RPC8
LSDDVVSDKEEQVWVWNFEGHRLFMDVEEEIRFRVSQELFHDTTSIKSHRKTSEMMVLEATKLVPYSLVVSEFPSLCLIKDLLPQHYFKILGCCQ